MTDSVKVYWRPGCVYCHTLNVTLRRLGVETARHNIWEDDDARAFVRSVNGGDETVPTVVIGDVTLTNPSRKRLSAELDRRGLLPERRPGLVARLLGRS